MERAEAQGRPWASWRGTQSREPPELFQSGPIIAGKGIEKKRQRRAPRNSDRQLEGRISGGTVAESQYLGYIL